MRKEPPTNRLSLCLTKKSLDGIYNVGTWNATTATNTGITAQEHKSTIIWLHDMSSSAADILPYFIKDKGYRLAKDNTKIVFPQATEEINDFFSEKEGERTESWFNEYWNENITRPFGPYNPPQFEGNATLSDANLTDFDNLRLLIAN